jgi:hypothetical protein
MCVGHRLRVCVVHACILYMYIFTHTHTHVPEHYVYCMYASATPGVSESHCLHARMCRVCHSVRDCVCVCVCARTCLDLYVRVIVCIFEKNCFVCVVVWTYLCALQVFCVFCVVVCVYECEYDYEYHILVHLYVHIYIYIYIYIYIHTHTCA